MAVLLNKKHTFQVTENKMIRKIFGAKVIKKMEKKITEYLWVNEILVLRRASLKCMQNFGLADFENICSEEPKVSGKEL
jgi:hypothetical protein